ncbi:MAG: hypothetical protein JO055_04400 [Alphaproteobacteria bacterium]|nr:hypothetical protein [Alphaproteobacteria bacterium]
MDFDGFLVQMRIEVEAVERATATLWELASACDMGETPGSLLAATAADERHR